jgi:hypothetical protein
LVERYLKVLFEQQILKQKEFVLDKTFLHVELFRLIFNLFLNLARQQLLNISLKLRIREDALRSYLLFLDFGRLENHA